MPRDFDDVEAQSRSDAAGKYRPERIRLLLVAHAPPDRIDRYFYFDNVREKDDLFRHVVLGLYGAVPQREHKATWLGRLQHDGIFLIDLVERPIKTVVVGRQAKAKDLQPFVPELIDRAEAVTPEHVVLIKVDVYDAAFRLLHNAGLPVIDERIPFPTTGRQRQFAAGFASALAKIGWPRSGG